VICGFCGKPYAEDRSQPACKACPLGSDCGLILCPHCGYENPGTPRWIAYLRSRFGGGSRDRDAAAERRKRRNRQLPVLAIRKTEDPS